MNKDELKKYKELRDQRWKEKEVFGLMKKYTDSKGVKGYVIKNCFKKGNFMLACSVSGHESKTKEDLYQAFLYDYVLGKLKEVILSIC